MMIPTSYGEWCNLFDEIEASARNEDYLIIIKQGSVSWTSGVAERYIQYVTKMINSRMNKAQDVYQTQLKNSGGNMIGVSRALQVLTKEYRYLFQIAKALPIPPDYIRKVAQLVQDQADNTVNSLMQSAKSDRTGKLASLVKSAGINKL